MDGSSVGNGNKLFLVGAASSDGGRTHTVSWKTSSFPFFQSKTTVVYSYYEDEAGIFCDGYLAISSTSYAEDNSKTYAVTVTGGEGSGSYAAGTAVILTAAPAPDGQIFDCWVIESGNATLSDKTAATTSFVMPAADVTVRATYVPLHIHAYGTDWVESHTEHWHECTCGDKGVATGHSHKQAAYTPPTCTEAGEDAYTCECRHGYAESIAATGHAYASTVTKQPTVRHANIRLRQLRGYVY